MQFSFNLITLMTITLFTCSCATEQEKSVVGTWSLYCNKTELEDRLGSLKTGNLLTVKLKLTADNESIEILEDNKRKYSSMSPGIWKIEDNRLSISMYTYTMYDAQVFNIVQIEEDKMVLTQGIEKYIWCRDE